MWPEWLKEGLTEITQIPTRMELDYLYRMRLTIDSGLTKTDETPAGAPAAPAAVPRRRVAPPATGDNAFFLSLHIVGSGTDNRVLP